MPALTLGADFAEAFNKLDQLNQKLGRQGEAIGQVSNEIRKYNSAGRLVSVTQKTLIAEFQNLIQTTKHLKDGSQRVTQQIVTDAAAQRAASVNSAKAQIQAYHDAAKSRKVFYDTVKQLANAELADQKALARQYAANAEIFARSQKRRDDAASAAFNSRFGRGGGGPTDDDNRKATLFDNIMNRIGRNLVQFASFRTFNLISDGIRDGVKAATDFQIQLSLIRTLSQENQQSFAKFGADVRNVSDDSGVDIKQVGKAFYDTISNQVAKGAAVKDFVKTATDLSRITGSELPDAVNSITSTLNAYGLSARDAERVSAVLFRTVDEGRIVLSETANTLGRVQVIAANLGVSYESVASVLSITTQKGFKTADAMTVLTNLLIKLEKPTDATRAFFNDLGVDTGEAAIRLFGFTGVLQKMVDAVRTGRVDVSAFFDEIRGRKQFGVFEQSIDQIKRFEDQLKDTSATASIYKKAIDIRGESDADTLIKQANKLANIFKVDFGQSILAFAADAVKAAGGVDALKKSADTAAEGVKVLGLGLTIYTVNAIAASVATKGLAAAITIPLAGAAAAATRILLPLTAAYAAFRLGQEQFLAGRKDVFGEFKPSSINASIEALDRYIALSEKARGLSSGGDNRAFQGFDDQKKNIEDSFRTALGLIAQANIANNRFLDDAKIKSKEVSEALKISFAGWLDGLKNGISEIKAKITEAKNEVEKSTKGTLRFKESLDDAVFSARLKFASDDIRIGNQKIQVIQGRIDQLTQRARQLYASGNAEEVDQGRKLIDDIAQLEQQKFDIKTEFERKIFEENNRRSGVSGVQIFQVSTEELQRRLNGLLTIRNNLELTYSEAQKASIATKEKELEKEESRLRTLQQAFKAYEDLQIVSEAGKVKPEFTDSSGRLSRAKVNAELDALEGKIRQNAGGTFQSRVQLEIELSKKRQALFAEAQAQERAEYLKTAQARIISEQEGSIKRQEDLRKARQDQIARQTALLKSLEARPRELEGFGSKLIAGGGVSRNAQDLIAENIDRYKRLVEDLKATAVKDGRDGVLFIDPNRLAQVREQYERIITLITNLRKNSGRLTDLTLTGENDKKLSPGGGQAGLRTDVDELLDLDRKLRSGFSEQDASKEAFDLLMKNRIDALKTALPELANGAAVALTTIDQGFKSLANGGVKELQDRLIEIERLMKFLNVNPDGSKRSAVDGSKRSAVDGIVPGFAAAGGIVGEFPGQPRGVDKYPMWLAAGERVLDSRTSATYAPMIDAMVNRRMPNYMANGGIAGDTQIGDISINVTVQGGENGGETGRSIAAKLQRELRRHNIRFQPR